MKNNKNYSKGIFFAIIGSLSLGFSGLIDKIGSSIVNNPFIFSIQSIFFALLFTLAFGVFFFRKDFTTNLKKTSFSSWKLIFGVGVFGSGIFILFRFLGLMQSTGTFATLSQIITTSLTAILASIFLKEKLSKLFWVLFLIIISSMYFVSTAKIAFVTMGNGDLLILAGTFFLAVANIFSKNAIKNTFPIILSFGRFLFGFIFLITISIFLFKQNSIFTNLTVWAILSGIVWTINILSFNLAIKQVGVILVTSLLMVAPIYTMVLENVFLKHNFNLIQVVAALIAVSCGILIIIPKGKSFQK